MGWDIPPVTGFQSLVSLTESYHNEVLFYVVVMVSEILIFYELLRMVCTLRRPGSASLIVSLILNKDKYWKGVVS